MCSECPVCYEEPTRCAVLVPCKHVLCITCAAKLQALANTAQCPLCRRRFDRFIDRATEPSTASERVCSVCFDRCALAEDECRAKQVATYARVAVCALSSAQPVSLAHVRAALDDTKAWRVSAVRRDRNLRRVVVIRQAFARVHTPSGDELQRLRDDAHRRGVSVRLSDRHEEPPCCHIVLVTYLHDLLAYQLRDMVRFDEHSSTLFHSSIERFLDDTLAIHTDIFTRIDHGDTSSYRLRR